MKGNFLYIQRGLRECEHAATRRFQDKFVKGKRKERVFRKRNITSEVEDKFLGVLYGFGLKALIQITNPKGMKGMVGTFCNVSFEV